MHALTTDARMINYELRISFSSELSNAANCFRYDEIRLLLFLFLQGLIIQGSESGSITFPFLITDGAPAGAKAPECHLVHAQFQISFFELCYEI
jgi:hypothetical protein